MINELVKSEVSKLKDTLDNYQRGRYSKSVAEKLIHESAQTILSTIKVRTTEDGNPVYSITREKPSGRPRGSTGKPYTR